MSEHTVQVRVREPEGFLPDGSMFVTPDSLEWSTVPFKLDGTCIHQETMCPGCLSSWMSDHDVRFSGDLVTILIEPVPNQGGQ